MSTFNKDNYNKTHTYHRHGNIWMIMHEGQLVMSIAMHTESDIKTLVDTLNTQCQQAYIGGYKDGAKFMLKKFDENVFSKIKDIID